MAKLTIFNIVDDCWTKKSGGSLCGEPDFETTMNNFMFCRILRMNDISVAIASKLNHYQKILTKADFYKFAYALIPKRHRAPYAEFIKKPKKEEAAKTNQKYETDEDGFVLL